MKNLFLLALVLMACNKEKNNDGYTKPTQHYNSNQIYSLHTSYSSDMETFQREVNDLKGYSDRGGRRNQDYRYLRELVINMLEKSIPAQAFTLCSDLKLRQSKNQVSVSSRSSFLLEKIDIWFFNSDGRYSNGGWYQPSGSLELSQDYNRGEPITLNFNSQVTNVPYDPTDNVYDTTPSFTQIIQKQYDRVSDIRVNLNDQSRGGSSYAAKIQLKYLPRELSEGKRKLDDALVDLLQSIDRGISSGRLCDLADKVVDAYNTLP